MTQSRDQYFSVTRTIGADTGVENLESISELWQPGVEQLATQTAGAVRTWLELYPSILTNRVGNLSRTLASICTEHPPQVCEACVKVAVLLFAIDDLVDGTICSPLDSEADALLELCRDLASSGGQTDIEKSTSKAGPQTHELAAMWREISVAFSAYCKSLLEGCPGEHYRFFAAMFVAAMEGMRTELRSRRQYIENRSIPQFDEYIKAGTGSIASPVVYAVLYCTLSPDFTPNEVSEEFALAGGTCLRLANDLRSYKRELEHEQRPNSVIILQTRANLTEKQAEAEVLALADNSLRRMKEMQDTFPESLESWGHAVLKFTCIMRDWYMVAELHTSPDKEED